MDRPVQVGDQARIIFTGGVQTYPIEAIKGLTLYISVGPGQSSLLIPDRSGKYQVQGLKMRHEVEFMATELAQPSILTKIEFLDLAILAYLDDESLKEACSINDHFAQLCAKDELWTNKITLRLGQDKIALKPAQLNVRNYYLSLFYPLSVAGANLAVYRNSRWALDELARLGYQPDIVDRYKEYLNDYVKKLKQINQDEYYEIHEKLIKFFKHAELGPQVTGSFTFNPDTATVEVTPGSLSSLEGTRLNDLLHFTRYTVNGQQNPLYGIVDDNTLMELFSIHAYYTDMIDPNDPLKLSASPMMRRYLDHFMRGLIDHGVKRAQKAIPKEHQLIQEISEQLKRAINDPTLQVNGWLNVSPNSVIHIFNPNSFNRDELRTLINEAISEIADIRGYEMTQLRPDIARFYSVIPGINPENAFEKVVTVYHDIVELAMLRKIEYILQG